ncbi:hypothetical protein Tco_1071863 [Tanacetum coccineum]
MTTLQFADTHNLVAFLAKPAKSEGFEQIVDFLNAHTIKYALKVNPTIYTSCIEQFWATIKAKTVNGEIQLQALVDGKKIIVTEASIRSDLQLNDEEGMDCLPNATIFEELTRIGAKTTAWNEFSRTMTYEIICLATNQKFNFSKYIFESMVKNLDNASKFLMYPRFVQVFLDKQLEGMSSHKRIYVTPSHTKKIFGNMKRVGKGFSRRETPLFPTMVVQNQAEMGEDSAIPTNPQQTPTIIQPSTSQPQKKQRSRRPKIKDTEVPQPSGPITNVADEAVYEERDESLERVATTATSLDAKQDSGNIDKTQSNATHNKPSSPGTSSGGGSLAPRTIRIQLLSLTAQAQEITSLKLRVKKLEKKGGSRTHKLKRLYKVGRSARIVSSDEASLGDQEDASKQGRKIDDIDKDAEITLVDETQGRYGDDIMFDVSDLAGEEVFVAEQGVPDSKKDDDAQVNTAATTVSTASTIPVSAASITDVEITLAQALVELKSAKPTTATNTRPKAKGLVKIKADCLLAERLQAREQDELTIEERAILFQQLLEKRRKHFAAKRAEEKRNRPPTKAQQRSIMCTYLKNMEGWKPKDLKKKSFDSIQKLFDKAIKRVNTFVDVDTELVKESSKKADAEIA